MNKIASEITNTLYSGVMPFVTAQPRFIDSNYPHSNIVPTLVDALLAEFKPTFWLELGSFVGGSAITVAEAINRAGMVTSVVCCDPFCGDVNMWDWEKDANIAGRDGTAYRFLRLENGVPTIYQRFLANTFFAGHFNTIVPIQATATVAIKLIKRLSENGRISELPTVIYLDSAHEEGETLLELGLSWNLLASNTVLLGDDWSWAAVKNDVAKFAKSIEINKKQLNMMHSALPGSSIENDILLYQGQWVLFK